MSARRFLAAFALFATAAFMPLESIAQYGQGGGQRFRCESNDGRTNQCGVDTRNGVVLVRQLSRGACIEGRTWGWDRRGVWVTQGCRAEFETGFSHGGPGWGGPGQGGPGWGGGQRVTCESRDQRTNYCDIDTRGGVVLVRQLSRGACIEGRSWGFDRRGVWVSQGCRAEFEAGRGGSGPGWGHGNPGHGNPGWGGGPGGGGQVIRCESRDGRTQYCDIGGARDVRLERQISRGACIEGQSWGWDRRGLWVANGCRGEFAVW